MTTSRFALIAFLAAAPAAAAQQPADTVAAAVRDSVPRVTLAEALRRAVRLDPDYVSALGQIDNAEWGRRAALASFILPSLSLNVDATKYSTAFFNIGTGQPQSEAVTGRVEARYDLFNSEKFTSLGRSRAELASAEATALEERFRAALDTESDYYAVLQNEALHGVAADRVRRAEEALAVARARVVSGAAVQTDSLQLVLELTQARVELLRQGVTLRVAQLQLGRRVGEMGPVGAVPIDTTPAPDLPIGLAEAVQLAVAQGPQYRAARASEQAAEAALTGQRGRYLPRLTLAGTHQRYDVSFFPNGRNVSAVTLTASWPLWDGASREIAISQARVNRDVARAIRSDLERSAARDVTQAYEAYNTARATVDLSRTGVVVARENFRVQETRYRAGATTILDLLDAQVRLSQAETDLVNARYTVQLALAGLEAILGRRLFPIEDAP